MTDEDYQKARARKILGFAVGIAAVLGFLGYKAYEIVAANQV